MINIESISKGFGDQALFDKASLQINPGERIGLVGRNGHGKTTLLNILIKNDFLDEGQIIIPNDYHMGFLTQKIQFTQKTVLEEALLGLLPHEQNQSWKAEKILAGLGFSPKDFSVHPDLFSGGFQVRLNLAKVLVSEPDLLILDEPTNYLDITSIRWISKFLQSWPREVLLVTHDRSFMDSVVTHIAGIHRQKIRKISGNTSKFYEQIAMDEEVYEKTRVNEEKRVKEIETFITRFRAKARLANMVQSRIKTLEKNQVKEKLSKIKNLDFSFHFEPFSGKQVLNAQNLSFSYKKDTPLIEDFSMTVYPEDRIAIIGKNGKGKTTLLKLLALDMAADSGTIEYNPGVQTGYFEQTNIQSLNDNFTVEEELIRSHPDSDRQAARNICGAMMFEQDNALKKIKVLSGGEKARVMLGKLLVSPLNLLLLDEPTNHLDMETCDSFIDALDDFEGAVVLVTHNEMFLHSLANRLVVFKNDLITVFDGTYQEFLEKEGWEEEPEQNQANKKTGAVSKKDLRKKRSSIVSQRSKELGPIQKEINTIENEIETHEQLLATLQEAVIKATMAMDGDKIQVCSIEIKKHENQIETLFSKLEKLLEKQDSVNELYDRQLKEIEKD